MNWADKFASGATTGVVTKSCTAPVERLKILYQVHGIRAENSKEAYGGSVLKGFQRMRKDGGIIGFWRGNGINCLRVIPVYSLKFGCNDAFKGHGRTLTKTPPGEKLGPGGVLLSGMLAGFTQITLTYPLEFLRTRLTIGKELGAAYTGIGDCLRKTYHSEGPRAFYKGYFTTVLNGTYYIGIQLSTYELLKRRLLRDGKTDTNIYEKLVCGGAAGACAQTIAYPGDVTRRRMQANGMLGQKDRYSGLRDCVRKIHAHEGARGFFRGIQVAWLRCIPGAAIQFCVYDYVSTRIFCSHLNVE